MHYLIAVLIINLAVFIHELGHYLVAHRYGVVAETFSIGIGPRLVGFTWRETDWRLSLLPFGGYVSFADEYYHEHISLWQNISISLAGPLANLIVSVPLLIVYLCVEKGITALTVLGPIGIALAVPFIAIYALVSDIGSAGGPIGLIHESPGIVADTGMLLYWIILNYSLAGFNLIPISILDGGHIAQALLNRLRPKWGDWWIGATSVVFFILIMRMFWNDITGLF